MAHPQVDLPIPTTPRGSILAVVARLCEQIIVLKDGQVVEAGETAEVMTDPKTVYTRTLVAASRATTLAGS